MAKGSSAGTQFHTRPGARVNSGDRRVTLSAGKVKQDVSFKNAARRLKP